MGDSAETAGRLERWDPTLWLAAGTLGVVYASLYGMEAVTGSYPEFRAFMGPVMNVLAFAALLGIYPVLVDDRPWLSRIGAGFAVLAIAGSILTVGVTAGLVSSDPPWVSASQLVSIVGGMSIAFLAFAGASLRSTAYSRTVGVLLLAPVAVMALNIAIVVAGYSSPEGRLLVSGLWAVTYLALGARLRGERPSSDPSRAASGTTTR